MARNTFEDYVAELDEAVRDAQEAAARKDARAIDTALERLQSFIKTSNNLIDGVDELDDVAMKASNDLVLAKLKKQFVDGLAEHTGEISTLYKRFSTKAALNGSSAASLRLDRARAVGESSLTAITRIKNLIEVIDDSSAGAEKTILAADAAIKALEKLWATLPRAT